MTILPTIWGSLSKKCRCPNRCWRAFCHLFANHKLSSILFDVFITDEKGHSGAIFLKTKDTSHYWQAFTGSEGRKKQIQYKIVWEGIIWAKRSGCKIFDFEGVFDERFPKNSWKGFTHFKKSFGGYEVIYPGMFVRNKFINLLKS